MEILMSCFWHVFLPTMLLLIIMGAYIGLMCWACYFIDKKWGQGFLFFATTIVGVAGFVAICAGISCIKGIQ